MQGGCSKSGNKGHDETKCQRRRCHGERASMRCRRSKRITSSINSIREDMVGVRGDRLHTSIMYTTFSLRLRARLDKEDDSIDNVPAQRSNALLETVHSCLGGFLIVFLFLS